MGRDRMALGEHPTEKATDERRDTELDAALRVGGSAAVGAGIGAAFIGGPFATAGLAVAGLVVGVLAPRFLSGRSLFHSKKPHGRPG
jgi:hypothetical protein